ncbi:hypothetical protein M5K25_015129 [Dendrobium thyrsiflorum]|uniref:Uncharacterized protein n=1 Tax=Dendrobium thyrsiflorum TaxID=117978 RepID=A0ABD0UQ97_DENTH
MIQLWKNTFTGSIPQQHGTKGRLLFLDLSSNKLISGPDDIKKLWNEGFLSPFHPYKFCSSHESPGSS